MNNNSIPKLCLAVLLLSSWTLQSVHADTRAWTGAAGTASWHDAGNWDPLGVPANGEDVIIDVPDKTVLVAFTTGTTSLNSLTCNENFTISGGTLNLASQSDIGGTFTLSAGTLGGAGNLTVTTLFNWNGGTMSGAGKTITDRSASLIIGGIGVIKTLSRAFENHGIGSYSSDSFQFAGGTLINLAAGVFEISGDGGFSSGGGTNVLSNAGTLTKTGVATFVSTIPLVNTGQVIVSQGGLQLNGGGSNSNTVNVMLGSTLTLNSTITHGVASLVHGSGTITFTGGAHVFPAGTLIPEGAINFSAGLITVNNQIAPSELGSLTASVTFNAPLIYTLPILIAGGTTAFNEAVEFPDVTLTAGTLTGNGNVTITEHLQWNGGSMAGAGSTIISDEAILEIAAVGVNKTLSRLLENRGTAHYSTSAFRFIGGTFNNMPEAAFIAHGSSGFVNGGGTNAFNNTGFLLKSGASSFVSSVPLNNSSAIAIEGGILQLSNGGSNTGMVVVDPGATIRLSSSMIHGDLSLLAGAGTVEFTAGTHVFPSDTFNPTGTVNFNAGTITINNSFSPSSLGTIGASNATVLTLNAPLNFPSLNVARTLHFNADQTLQNLALTSSNARIGGSGDLTIVNSLSVASSSTFEGSGVTNLTAGCTTTMTAGSLTISRTLNNLGVVLAGSTDLLLLNGTLNNHESAVIHFGNGGGTSGLGGTNHFSNAGVIHVNDTGSISGGLFTNTGVVNVHAPAALAMHTDSGLVCENSGIINVDSGARLTWGADTHHTATSIVQGGGDFTPAGGVHTFDGQFLLTGTLTCQGHVTINNTFQPSGLVTVRGTLTVNAPQVWDSLHLVQTGGSELNGTGDVTILNNIQWRGYMRGSGRTILAPGGFVPGNAGLKHLGRPFDNYGTFNFTAGDLVFNNGTFNNMAGGTFATDDASFSIADGGGTNVFNNYGTFVIGTLLDMYVPLLNYGIVNLPTNELQMRRPYIQAAGATVLSGGSLKSYSTFTVSGGAITGNGNVLANILQTGGVLSPGHSSGSLAFYSVNQEKGGTFDIELGGHVPAREHDIITADDLTLSGTLRLTFIDGFTPQSGDSFILLAGVTVSGAFSAIDVIGYPNCIVNLTYDQKGGVIIATVDDTPPIAICRNIVARLDDSGHVTVTAEQIDNGSNDDCAIADRQLSHTEFTCGDVGSNVVMLTVVDHAGNQDSCEAVVTVVGNGNYQGAAGGSWFTVTNWCGHTLPDDKTDVAIATHVLVDKPGAVARSLDIRPGGELFIDGTGTLRVFDTLRVESGGTLVVAQGGSLTVRNLLVESEANVIWTGGTITIDAGSWIGEDDILIGCSGRSATLRLLNGGSVSAPSIMNCNDGTIVGDGSLIANVANSGVIQPGFSIGVITVMGNFEQTIDGALLIDVGEPSLEVEHDVLVTKGIATVDGTLTIHAKNDFEIQCGDEFQVMLAQSIVGMLSEVVSPTTICGTVLSSQIGEQGLSIIALPASPSLDINCDGTIGVPDLLAVISAWGACPAEPCDCRADVNDDNGVGVPDLLAIISSWGPI